MKLLVDISRAVADGILTAEQGDRLARIAARETIALAINALLSAGVIAVSAGFLALEPALEAVAGLGLLLVLAGYGLRLKYPASWGIFGSACVLIGALAVSGGILVKWDGRPFAFLAVTVILLALAVLARSGLLVALAVIGVAGLLGSGTGYGHAMYIVWVQEPTLTIVVFAALAWLAFLLMVRVPQDYQGLPTTFARISVVAANFGFWIGSLWGDYPLETWLAPTHGDWQAREDWRAHWLHISPDAFSIAWALALLGFGAWGAACNRRFAVNTVAVFFGIHFYTQWFERLGASPSSVIIAGLIAVAASTGLWRYNQGRSQALSG